MNKSSISSIINFIFIMAAALLILTFILYVVYEKNQFIDRFNHKYDSIAVVIDKAKKENSDILSLASKLKIYNLKLFYDKEALTYAKNSSTKDFDIIEYNSKMYLFTKYKNIDLLFIDNDFEPYNYYNILILFAVSLVIILFCYYLITINIKPLKELTLSVERFSKGDFDVKVKVQGDNEISALANAFNNAVKHTQKVNESRRLFMRNIMHEIKTPITKGNLLLQLPHNEKNQLRLENVFNRLQELIDEFTIIEQYDAGLLTPNLEEHRFIDMYNKALQIAMIYDENIKTRGNMHHKFLVDKKLFSIAIKNMIDNALKYSPNKEVLISVQKDKIDFINKGEKLDRDLAFYIQPFTKKVPSAQSLGLGLYIVYNILKANNMKLTYRYTKHKNIFSFELIK